MAFCSNCGNKLDASDKFCDACGARVENESDLAVHDINRTSYDSEQKPMPQPDKIAARKRKKHTRGLVIAVVVLSVVLIATLILLVRIMPNKVQSISEIVSVKSSCLIYGKDNELKDIFFINLKSGQDPYKVGSGIEVEAASSDADLGDIFASVISGYPRMSKDGKRLFYVDKNADGKRSLYCRILYGISKETIELEDLYMRPYILNFDGTVLTYFDDSKNLCQYYVDKKSKVTIDRAGAYRVSEDGKVIYFIKNKELYRYLSGKDPYLVAKKINEITFVSKDYSTVYYSRKSEEKGLELFKRSDGEEEELIASDIDRLLKVYDTGDAYYLTKEDDEYEDYVYSLFYYDGKTSTLLSNRYCSKNSSVVFAAETPIAVYQEYNDNEYSDNLIDTCVAVKEKSSVISGAEDAVLFSVNDSGTTVFYIDLDEEEYDEDDDENKKEINTGTVYRVSVADGNVTKPETYDNNVCITGSLYKDFGFFIDDNTFAYYKNYVSSGQNEFYINKIKVDDNVTASHDVLSEALALAFRELGFSYMGNKNNYYVNGVFYYATVTDKENLTISLKAFDGKNITEISKDIGYFTVYPEGRVVYTCNFNSTTKKSDLCEWYKGEGRKIDDGVSWFMALIA